MTTKAFKMEEEIGNSVWDIADSLQRNKEDDRIFCNQNHG